MTNTIHINAPAIMGLQFPSPIDPTIDYTCVGYGQNDTTFIVGATYDSISNRTALRTFKMSEVKFKGPLLLIETS